MTSPDPRVLLLGTGGGITPKDGRQSTASAFRCEHSTYVVDCGNGVGPQLIRARVPLESVRAIFLTHHHFDHVADFGALLAQCWSRLSSPVTVVGPPPLRRMFSLFLELFGIDFNGRVSEEGRRPLEEFVNLAEITGPGPCYQDEFVSVSAARVMHPPLEHAYAYRFDHEHVSVVFSGDTAPSEVLAEFACDASTLVHEATFPPALAKSFSGVRADRLLTRLARAHSPVADAARIATLAGVSQLILSPLVPSIGVGDEEWTAAARKYFSGGIVVGRDLLEVPV